MDVLAQANTTDTQLPVDVLSWALSLAAIAVLLFLLVVRNWAATAAGPVGLLVSVIVALTAFDTPTNTLVVAGAKGVWDAVPIVLIIFTAILLYRVGTAAGAFHALRIGVQRWSKNEVFLVLGFGWVFASFMQGIAGFGAPIAIVAPILVALRVRPVYAVVIPLIGHAWAKFFGTLGVGWVATTQVVDLEDQLWTAVLTSMMLLIPIFTAGIAIAWFVGRMKAVWHSLPMVLIITLLLGGGQIGFVYLSPELSTFLAGTLALIALYPLSRWSRYRQPAPLDENLDLFQEVSESSQKNEPEPIMNLGWALAPYLMLTVVSVVVLLIPPVDSFLGRWSFAPAFPEVTTGYAVTHEAAAAYEPLAPLTSAAGFLFFAIVLAALIYWLRGDFRKWREISEPPPVWRTTGSDSVPASTAVVTFLILASVMSHSGQTEVLALGIAAATTPVVYGFLANFIGILGALVTNSSTSSNVLFAPVHDTVASTQGVSQAAVIAAQSTGGAVGNVIAPANIILGATTAGISGREGEIFRKAIPWAIGVAVLTGLATIPLL